MESGERVRYRTRDEVVGYGEKVQTVEITNLRRDGANIRPGWTTSWARAVRLAMAGERDPSRPGESARPVPRAREETCIEEQETLDLGSTKDAYKRTAGFGRGNVPSGEEVGAWRSVEWFMTIHRSFMKGNSW
ncbi:hypothetical protein AAC387_Pa04g1655 [Persea americana]